MILADTSVWIDHFRSTDKALQRALHQQQIVIHPFVIAELALGSLKDRARTLRLLDSLPQARVAQTAELRHTIESRNLYNLGIGLTDAHLLASVFLDAPTLLWTRDKQLRKAAQTLGVYAGLA
jgi:predicted nucleic acid-binding protein